MPALQECDAPTGDPATPPPDAGSPGAAGAHGREEADAATLRQLLREAQGALAVARTGEAAEGRLLRGAMEAAVRDHAARAEEAARQQWDAARRAVGLEADLTVMTIAHEALAVTNGHLAEEVDWLRRELAAQLAAADHLRAERHAAVETTAALHRQVAGLTEELRSCVEATEALGRRSAAQERAWEGKLAAAATHAARLEAENADLTLKVERSTASLALLDTLQLKCDGLVLEAEQAKRDAVATQERAAAAAAALEAALSNRRAACAAAEERCDRLSAALTGHEARLPPLAAALADLRAVTVRLLATSPTPAPAPASAEDLDAVAVARRCVKDLQHLADHPAPCDACPVLRGQIAGLRAQVERRPGEVVAEERRGRRMVEDLAAEWREAAAGSLRWAIDADVLRVAQRALDDAARRWDVTERQQRRTIAVAEAEDWAKIQGLALRYQRWRATTSGEGRPAERRRPTVAWIGIEIAEGRSEARPEGAAPGDATAEGPGDGGLGVRVVVAKGPAARQGVRVGDLITHLNDRPTGSLSHFKCAASKLKPGQVARLTVTRPGPPAVKETIEVSASEVDKELFTPGTRSQRPLSGRQDSFHLEALAPSATRDLATRDRDKENRPPTPEASAVPSKDLADAVDPRPAAAAAPLPDAAPRLRCRSGPVTLAPGALRVPFTPRVG